MRFNQLPNGDLWVVETINPPPAPKGYIANTKKPYYYHLVLKECNSRYTINEKLCCKNSKIVIYCDKLEKQISQIRCKDCKI
jgi:hypothetical protein